MGGGLVPMTTDQKIAFNPFGAGSRICLGLHLALMELRYSTAEFFRECSGMRLAEMEPDAMDMVNYFLVVPKRKHCMITMTADL